MKYFMVLFTLFTVIALADKKQVEMPAIFSDNMVLQQNSSVPFWGKAKPGTKINIEASWGKNANALTGADGNWKVNIQTPSAGGPFDIKIQAGDTTITFNNVLSGEVWVCSGQSNMEMPMTGFPPTDTIVHSASEVKNADYPNIRFFSVARVASDKKEFTCNGTWKVCTPEAAASFSATAFFFGKKLNKDLNVPVGLINTSWGGTPVESWINGDVIGKFDQYKTLVEDLKSSAGEIKVYNEWLNSHKSINIAARPSEGRWENLEVNDSKCMDVNFDDSNWKLMELPKLWESDVPNFDGVIWFRKKVSIPSEWVNKKLVLELGPIDDMDRSYVNGIFVGGYEKEGFYKTDRIFTVPAEAVTSTEIVIAVKAIDNQGGGGLFGRKDQLRIHPENSDESVSLAGEWRYLPVAEYRGQKLFIFGSEKNDYYSKPPVRVEITAYTPSALYNGMISPLVPYKIKGAIWYQGEANVGNANLYHKRFSTMIENWRNDWGIKDLPFYFVQIAPFDYGKDSHSELLREAQLQTMLSVPNSGMAVTMDIGMANNIHPPYKKEVGERLEAWALAKTYNKTAEYSGPVYKSFKTEGNKIILSFDHAKGLVLKEASGENNFMIAGSDKVFKKAKVKVENDMLVISSDEVTNPAAVRYAWDNISEGTLFNGAGLPASSFRTDKWE